MISDALTQLPKEQRKSKKRSSQSARDSMKINDRIKINGGKIEYVSDYINRLFDTHVTSSILISLANIFLDRLNLKLDRLAKRNRTALLCWYAENWNVILCVLQQMDFSSLSTSQKLLWKQSRYAFPQL